MNGLSNPPAWKCHGRRLCHTTIITVDDSFGMPFHPTPHCTTTIVLLRLDDPHSDNDDDPPSAPAAPFGADSFSNQSANPHMHAACQRVLVLLWCITLPFQFLSSRMFLSLYLFIRLEENPSDQSSAAATYAASTNYRAPPFYNGTMSVQKQCMSRLDASNPHPLIHLSTGNNSGVVASIPLVVGRRKVGVKDGDGG